MINLWINRVLMFIVAVATIIIARLLYLMGSDIHEYLILSIMVIAILGLLHTDNNVIHRHIKNIRDNIKYPGGYK